MHIVAWELADLVSILPAQRGAHPCNYCVKSPCRIHTTRQLPPHRERLHQVWPLQQHIPEAAAHLLRHVLVNLAQVLRSTRYGRAAQVSGHSSRGMPEECTTCQGGASAQACTCCARDLATQDAFGQRMRWHLMIPGAIAVCSLAGWPYKHQPRCKLLP